MKWYEILYVGATVTVLFFCANMFSTLYNLAKVLNAH